MAIYKYSSLRDKYEDFENPVAVLTINDREFANNKNGFILSDIEVELTCGYEASIASFTIYNTFDQPSSRFLAGDAKNYISLGYHVDLALGYASNAIRVFSGFIAKVNFIYPENDVPGIRITALDVKGIMMANNYSKQLKATSYGEAVKEIFEKNVYVNMQNKKIINKLYISDTPDKTGGAGNPVGAGAAPGQKQVTDRTIEMVCESDYEFVVKAAKKYNYEFFAECGSIYFRKAKSNRSILIDMGPHTGLRTLDVEYDLTGLVSSVEARGMDTGKGSAIVGKKEFSNSISKGNQASKLLKKSAKVYIDPTITSQNEADSRAQSLLEEMSYRFGTLQCDCIGLPELLPGYFINLKEFGNPPDNKFYIATVRHTLSEDRGFETRVTGKAASIGGGDIFGLI